MEVPRTPGGAARVQLPEERRLRSPKASFFAKRRLHPLKASFFAKRRLHPLKASLQFPAWVAPGATICALLGACGSSVTAAQSAHLKAIAQEKQQVLAVWEDAANTAFDYSAAGPPPGFRQSVTPGLYADTNAALNWLPKFAQYETGQALRNDVGGAIADWAAGVFGPTTYSLGHPAVTITSATSATVVSCIDSAGWVDPPTQPPPGIGGWPNGGMHLQRNFLAKENGHWYVTINQLKKGVTKC